MSLFNPIDLGYSNQQITGYPNFPNIYLFYDPVGFTANSPAASTRKFIVYVRLKGTYYGGFVIGNQVNTSENMNLYRTFECRLYKRTLVGSAVTMVDQGVELITDGENEFTLQQPGKNDLTFGYHGDEVFTEINFFIDGTRMNGTELATGFDMRPCSSFSFRQLSNGTETDNPAKPVIFTHYKKTSFFYEGSTYVTVNNIKNVSTVTQPIETGYFGIVCVSNNVAAFANNEIDPVRTMANIGNLNTHYLQQVGGNTITYTSINNDLGCEVTSKILNPIAQDNLCVVDTKDNVLYGKYYRSLVNYSVPVNGEVKGETRVKLFLDRV